MCPFKPPHPIYPALVPILTNTPSLPCPCNHSNHHTQATLPLFPPKPPHPVSPTLVSDTPLVSPLPFSAAPGPPSAAEPQSCGPRSRPAPLPGAGSPALPSSPPALSETAAADPVSGIFLTMIIMPGMVLLTDKTYAACSSS